MVSEDISVKPPGWGLIRCLMFLFHLLMAIFCIGVAILLGHMETHTSLDTSTAAFHMVIVMNVFAAIYCLVGVITFLYPTPFLARLLAALSLFILAVYYFSFLSFIFTSAMCGIDNKDMDNIEVTFSEERIKHCEWRASTCLLEFPPDVVTTTCSTVPHFWKFVQKVETDELGGFLINRLLPGGIIYNILIFVLVFLTFPLSMIRGVRKVVLQRPNADLYTVPMTHII